jgi:creatinine amidohydrolase
LEEAGDGNAKLSILKGIHDKTAWIPRKWDKVSEDTGVGNPKRASAEKGKKYLEDVTSKIAEFFIEFAECDLENLYQ